MSGQNDIILHHYDVSPFSEKIRVIFGLKGIAWKSVQIPPAMPKPDLMPLTGGYRKTPVMQIGADIYCDTQLIAREIERRIPQPTLFPRGHGLHRPAAMWADRTWFTVTAGLVFGVNCDAIPDAFLQDRAEFSKRSTDRATLKAGIVPMRMQWRAYVGWIEEALADGRPYLTGEACGLGDISAYMNVWFLKTLCPPEAGLVGALPKVSAWAERMAALGNGTREELSAASALDIAAGTSPQGGDGAQGEDPEDLTPGTPVSVMPDDTGRVPVKGTVLRSTEQTLVIRREDPRVGEVAIHLPKAGFFIQKRG